MPETTSGPALTEDLKQAKADIDQWGYCLVPDVLSPEQVAVVKERLVVIAAQEIEDGTDYVYENGANQRVWTLLNKGDCFVELVFEETSSELIRHLLGSEYLLSNIDANIAGPGGNPMFLHADQSFVPAPWPPYALVANCMWMLDDFTPENGATRMVPASHKSDGTNPPSPEEAVPITAPPGSICVFDGRLWHQTGANVTENERRHGILAYYCRPFMRMQESWHLTIDPAVLEKWGAPLKHLLAYDLYLSLGMVDGMPRKGLRF